MQQQDAPAHRLCKVALPALFLLALMVIFLGAYTRIKDAGLGCPDWPGCYGHWSVPNDAQLTLQEYPDTPLAPEKAWLEMIHRYAAGTLGLGLLALYLTIGRRAPSKKIQRMSLALCLLVVFQAALGMWTVTLKLWPIVVMGHLLGGLAIVSLCWYGTVMEHQQYLKPMPSTLHKTVLWVLALLVLQITLGGWTSANYAALSCPDFPYCNNASGMAWQLHAFAFWEGWGLPNPLTGMNHLDRMSIHMAHRLGALALSGGVLFLAIQLWRTNKVARGYALFLTSLLLLQGILGWANVAYWLPWPLALLHHMVAVLLLLTLITLAIHTNVQRAHCR
ncbi:MAG: COX15/CtaA family protein [Pseudomonadota bacterium]